MIATTNASSTVSQTVAVDSITGSENIMSIASVVASGVWPETSLVEVNITTGREFLASAFANGICPFHFAERGDGLLESCSLAANGNHKHEIKVKRSYRPADAPLTDNPIPAGAVRLLESSAYIDLLEPLPQGYCSIEQIRSVFIKEAPPQCPTYVYEDRIEETCSVEAGLHIHTKKKQMSIPQSECLIPEGALSFYQEYSYASNETKFFIKPVFTFDPNDPPNEPNYSRKFLADKLEKEHCCEYKKWQVPHGWDALPRSVREKRLDDIVRCYRQGASRLALSEHHGVSTKNINALLLLRLSREEMIQICVQERIQSKTSPFADACKFDKTLGELLNERVRARRSTKQRRVTEKAKKLPAEPAPTTSSAVLSQDASLPPKKRISFRAFQC